MADKGDVLLVGLLIGLVLGGAVLTAGYLRGQMKLGLIGLGVCVVAGLVLGIFLALPAAIVFFVLIFRRPRGAGAGEAESAPPQDDPTRSP